MTSFLFRRILSIIPVLIGVSIVVFTMQKMIPGDAATSQLGPMATGEEIEALRRELGLDRPIPEQYAIWLGSVVKGDFGRSIALKVPVYDAIMPKMGNTLILAGFALAFALVVGTALGVLAGMRPNTRLDRGITLFAITGSSMPGFWVGLVLMWIFAIQLRWLPSTGMFSIRGGGGIVDLMQHVLLPALTASMVSIALLSRLVRSAVLEIMQQDYIRTARAKGLGERVVAWKHTLRNAIPPIIGVIGVQVGLLLGGSLFVEVVFSWPGMGLQLFSSISARDTPMVQASVLLTATIFSLANLGADLLHGLADPRIRMA
jgi:peptide/nickel transport system permease protein